ncbi:hypothetical protein D3C78_860350 [compost metagenome]
MLAHPGLYGDDDLVISIIEKGRPTGIEVYHSDHGPEDEQRYLQIAERYDLLPTAGSDYHGVREGVIFHGDLGTRTVSLDTVEQLRRAAGGGL